MANPIVTAAVLGEAFDLKSRRVQQLVEEGIIPAPKKRDQYDLYECTRGYVRYLRDRAMHGGRGPAVSYSNERARLMSAKADTADMERRRMFGELVPRADIEPVWLTIAAVVKSRLLAIPAKLAQRILTARNATQAESMLREEISEALEELSKSQIEDVDAPVPSDRGPNGARGDGEPSAAAEANDQPMG